MASNLVGQVRSNRVGGFTACVVPAESAAQIGDWQVAAWVSHVSVTPPTLSAEWTRLLNRATTHNRLCIYRRQLTAATDGADSGVTFPAVNPHQGADVRTYRGALTNVTVMGQGDGLVAPARSAIAGTLVRIWADSEDNGASLPPNKVFVPPAGVMNPTDPVFRNFQWYNGLLTADDPTAVGADAPTRTAQVVDFNNNTIPVVRFPQYADVLLDEPAPVNPATPINLAAVPTQTGATLSWTDAGSGVAPDDYDYRINGGSAVDVNLATSVVVSGLTPDTDYTFSVRARTSLGGASAWSAPVAFRTLPAFSSSLRVGTGAVTGLQVGSSKVTRVYLGSTQVYDSP